MEDTSGVEQVPMLVPIIMGNAEAKVIAPVPAPEIACKIPTVAAELCVRTVTIAPVITPRMGVSRALNIFLKPSQSARGATAVCIFIIPVKSMAMPSSISPLYFCLFFY